MLELPTVALMQIFTYLMPKETLKNLQFVSKSWFEAANESYNWHEVKIATLDNKSINGFLWTHGKHFRKLTIKSTRLSRKATYNIFHNCNKLQELDLKDVYTCSLLDDRFCFLISKIKTLTSLIFPTFTKMKTTGFNHLCKLTNLETLNLKRNYSIDNFQQLKKLTKLKVVDLSGCRYINNDFCAAISALKLRILMLSYCYSVTIRGLKSFLSVKHPELEQLVINGINYTVSFFESVLAKSAINLLSLSLNCLSIDENIYKSLKYLKKLENLTIIGCSKIKDFRVFKSIPLKYMCVCRTSFDVFGNRGLIEFAQEKPRTKFFLFDNYAINHRQQLFKAVNLLNNVVLHYS
jgi:hypothetical protein